MWHDSIPLPKIPAFKNLNQHNTFNVYSINKTIFRLVIRKKSDLFLPIFFINVPQVFLIITALYINLGTKDFVHVLSRNSRATLATHDNYLLH